MTRLSCVARRAASNGTLHVERNSLQLSTRYDVARLGTTHRPHLSAHGIGGAIALKGAFRWQIGSIWLSE